MRNLKKVGCLILCLALMMSVAVFNVGAAFSDQKDIQHTEAVGMCTALNIIGGYPDGSYKPAGNITRAEMCKMLCVALNGGEEPVLGTVTKHTFSDVQNNKNSAWAEPYIESCYSQGIVSGIGGGLFNPSGSITGTQAAKMLLVALGYQSDKQGYTGANWEINVNVDASSRGLYKELGSINPSAALSRDSAAQMIWNALQANEVEYKTTLSTDANGQLVSTATLQDKVVGSNSDKIDLMTDKYDTLDKDTTTGILTNISYNSTDGKYTYTLSNNNSDTLGSVKSFKTTAGYTDLLGMNVCFVAKDKDTVYGAYAKDSSVIVSGYVGDITFDDADQSGKQRIKVDGAYYDLDTKIVNASADSYAKLVKYTEQNNQTSFDYASAKDVSEDNGNAVPMYYSYKAIDVDNDNDIDFIVYYPMAFGEITYVGSDYTRINVVGTYIVTATSGNTAFKADYGVAANTTTDIVGHIATDSKTSTKFDTKDSTDYTLYEGAARDDYGMVAYDTTLKTDGTITKLDKMSGNLDGIAGDNATLGGTVYDMSQLTTLSAGKEVKVFGNTNLNKNQKFRAINGYLVWTDSNASNVDISDYVVVTGVASSTASSGYYQADLLFTDGTKKTVDVKSVNNGTTTYTKADDNANLYANLKESYLYTYEVSSGKYELTFAPSDEGDTGFDSLYATGINTPSAGSSTIWNKADSASKANARITIKDNKAKIDSTAVVFVADTDNDGDTTYSVKTGADLAKVTSSETTVYYAGAENNDNDFPYVTLAYVNTKGISSTDTQYGFITSDVNVSKDDDGTYYDFTVWNGTESVQLSTIDKADLEDFDPTIDGANLAKKAVIAYKLNSDGKISCLSVYDAPATETPVSTYTQANGYKFVTASPLDSLTNTRSTVNGDTTYYATAVMNADSDTVTVVMPNGALQEFSIDDNDTTVLYVDRDGKKGETDGSIQTAVKMDTTTEPTGKDGMWVKNGTTYYYDNVLIAYDQTDYDSDIASKDTPTLDLLVVDTANDFFHMN